MFLCRNPLSRLVMALITLLFITVFITEWKTWINTFTFTEKRRLKKIRKDIEKREINQ